MPREFLLKDESDHQEALLLAVSCLESGHSIRVPDECGWSVFRLATQEEASSAIWDQEVDSKLRQSVALPHPDAIFDYLHSPSRLISKLTSRCWPGPVIFRSEEAESEKLIENWPVEARNWAKTSQGRAFSCPAHDFTLSLLKSVSSPVLSVVGTHQDQIPSHLANVIQLTISSENHRFSAPPTVVSVSDQSFQVERPGVVSERMLERLSGEVYLFVCTGNTCRSPMAESIFRSMLTEKLGCRDDELMDLGYVVLSAGLAANRGDVASPEAVYLLRENGIDLSAHESQPVTNELLKHCDHVLTMTRSHRDSLLSIYPHMAGQVRLLAQNSQDIPDPIGCGMDEYVRCRDAIRQNLELLLGKMDFSKSKGSFE